MCLINGKLGMSNWRKPGGFVWARFWDLEVIACREKVSRLQRNRRDAARWDSSEKDSGQARPTTGYDGRRVGPRGLQQRERAFGKLGVHDSVML